MMSANFCDFPDFGHVEMHCVGIVGCIENSRTSISSHQKCFC